MKKKWIIIGAVCLVVLICAAALITFTGSDSENTEPTQEPTVETAQPPTQEMTQPTVPEETQSVTEPTEQTEPAPIIYRNPLNGEVMDEAYVGRVFAVSINNSKSALPFHGVSQADVFFEMYVNEYATRGLALFSNVSAVESIGSIRSTRYNFTDICQAYNSIMCHANCSDVVRADMNASGIDQMSADSSIGYRDYDRYNNRGYAWEHCLFAVGSELEAAARKKGFDLEISDQDYGMNFTEEAVPADGEDAAQIEIVFTIGSHKKSSIMKYDESSGQYVFWQYSKKMTDENNGADICFTNVIVILAENTNEGVYHIADLNGQGDGYFACGGRIIPIRWIHEAETDPITFFLKDGTPLMQGIGSTYVAIAPIGSAVKY